MTWANNFYEILPTLTKRSDIVNEMKQLVSKEKIIGKSLEGTWNQISREEKFKSILVNLIEQKIDLNEAYRQVEAEMGRKGSPYVTNNRVFPKGWGERLIRIQLSIFYNYAVLNILLNKGEKDCVIPHSKYEKPDSRCTVFTGQTQKVSKLRDTLIDVYFNGNYDNKGLKIPEHPHCTHVIKKV